MLHKNERREIYTFTVRAMNGEQPFNVSVDFEAESHLWEVLQQIKEGNLTENLFSMVVQMASNQAVLLDKASDGQDYFFVNTSPQFQSALWTMETLFNLANRMKVEQGE